MKVDIVFVRMDKDERREIPFADVTKEEQEEQELKLKKRFFGTLGYVPKDNTA